jgi:peptide/nickel transport system permease protein
MLRRLGAFWLRYKKNSAGVIGLGIIILFSLTAIIAPLSPYHPLQIGVGPSFHPPSYQYLFGTDNLGRDVLTRVAYGAQIALTVGLIAAFISTLLGILSGAIAGYFGGWIDDLLMRITDFFLVIPRFFLALVVVAVFGASLLNIIIIIGVLPWPSTARLVRAEFLTLRERQFVDALRIQGASNLRIIFREILPNAMPPIIVMATIQVASAIVTEAGLSFLGLGIQNVASWGYMLSDAQSSLREAWWMAFFPGACIFLTAMSLNFIGDSLNEALNPRLKER